MRFRRSTSDGEPSIYAHVAAHLTEDGLTDRGAVLPDEVDASGTTGLRWAPGALEGVMGRHARPERDEELVRELHAAFVALADHPGPASRARVRSACAAAAPRTHADGLLDLLRAEPPQDAAGSRRETRELVTTTGRRSEVKFGLAVLGVCGAPDDVPLMQTLGRHDEFTLYAAVAMAGLVEDPVTAWMALARTVHGWGRVEMVSLLLRRPREDVCAWLLRDGFRNRVLYGYTAHLVAERCDLAAALHDDADDALVAGARDILATLAEDAWGGPAGGLLDYEDGLAATRRLLALLEPRALTDFLAVDTLRVFAEDNLSWAGDDRAAEEASRVALGWTEEARGEIAAACRRVQAVELWPDLVRVELSRGGDTISNEALEVARRIGMPTADVVEAHLRTNPGDGAAWYQFLVGADAATLERALAVARDTLPLDDLASGPALDLDRAAPVHRAATYLLQALKEHPGIGWDLLRRALRSPVIRDRRVALAALANWPTALLTAEHLDAVAHVRDADPDPDTRAQAEAILRR